MLGDAQPGVFDRWHFDRWLFVRWHFARWHFDAELKCDDSPPPQ